MKKIVTLILLVLMIGITFAATTLTQEEESIVLRMLEEEKLARDVYNALYEKWGTNPFSNIGSSEQKHFDAVMDDLAIPFGITLPDTLDQPGVFSNPELQKLYNELVEAGSVSLMEAYRVGMTIEDVDIYDLDNALQNMENAELRIVFANLLRASESHMSTFNYQLQKYGITYAPQYISQNRFELALQTKTYGNGGNGNQSTGNGQNGSGQNGGNSQGNQSGNQNGSGGNGGNGSGGNGGNGSGNGNNGGKGRNR
jgi:hypothetical protein